ncbi:MAG TPA: RteC protein [Porphyromonadaceae bacterium]|jgi:hypothetical protein|nr:RteC protein [Porphyromonadaceae bacterium]HBX21755.1 RteC protein [Porphyromonadaceae bacterium]HCM19730.1 RteC protein [Porphyromonadaceae bacterium]
MIDYVARLRKETDDAIDRIESSDSNILKKSLDASHVLAGAFDKLKKFILSYEFQSEAEEINFFKEIKPKFCYRLIYYRKLYNIEMNRPVAAVCRQKEYLHEELDTIHKYTNKRLDFVRYYRSGSTHLDSLYFLRGRIDTEQYLETFYYELDQKFSTNCDFKVAKILSNDMLQAYLMQEIALLETDLHYPSSPFPKVKLTWKGTKTELTEQLYSWDSDNIFGDIPLTQVSDYIQNVFNIQLDKNLSRAFSDMKIRTQPTPFLDKLKEALLRRMGREK